MSWSEEYIRDLRGRLAEAKRQGLWLSAMDVAFFRELVTWWTKASMQGFGRPNDGMLPTVGSARQHRVTHLFVHCETRFCHQTRRIALDQLHMPPGRRPVPDHVAFIDLPKVCRFRCSRCQGRKVSVMAHWPTNLASQYGPSDPYKPDPVPPWQRRRDDEG